MTHVAKVIELVGSSDKGWTEAAQASTDKLDLFIVIVPTSKRY
jgi:flavin-binding protein dodecin